jgi:hypothetical protein
MLLSLLFEFLSVCVFMHDGVFSRHRLVAASVRTPRRAMPAPLPSAYLARFIAAGLDEKAAELAGKSKYAKHTAELLDEVRDTNERTACANEADACASRGACVCAVHGVARMHARMLVLRM